MEICCEHCGCVLSKSIDGRIKLRVPSRLVAFDQGGCAEMNCPACGQDTHLPVRFTVRVNLIPEPLAKKS